MSSAGTYDCSNSAVWSGAPELARNYSPASFGEEVHFFLKRGKELFKLTIITNSLGLDFYSHVATCQRQKKYIIQVKSIIYLFFLSGEK